MKPLKLEMQCFGSFYESCEINFEELSRNRIFLITGRTGSGKTTILDAMCCALYGSATGEGRQWELMRSMIAPENKPTFVNFTFSIGNKLYRFERTMQIKERKRGGEKIKSAETQAAAFEFADGEWSMIAKNPREVQQAAQRLLGFTREQFVQIIILPQGEFKKLLLANSKEKSVILESLFLASRWKDIAGAAALKSRQLNESLLAMRSEYTALLGSFGCLASDDLDKKITESAQNEASLLSDIEKTEGQLSEAEKELEKMRSLSDAFLQLDKWQRTVKELEEKQAQIDSLRCDTEKSEKLLSLLPFFDRMNGALLRHKQQKESSKRLAEQKERAQVFLNARRQKYDALPAMRKQAERTDN